jgi:uncharacterized membrane protein
MLIFKFLHILSMFVMVTIEIGLETLFAAAISRGDVRALAAIYRLEKRLRAGPIAIAALVAGIVFGLLTAATGGFNFLDGWLIAAYVLVAIFLVSSTMFLRPALRFGQAAADAEAAGGSTDELAREMGSSRVLLWYMVDVGLVVAIIADMVFKPF